MCRSGLHIQPGTSRASLCEMELLCSFAIREFRCMLGVDERWAFPLHAGSLLVPAGEMSGSVGNANMAWCESVCLCYFLYLFVAMFCLPQGVKKLRIKWKAINFFKMH